MTAETSKPNCTEEDEIAEIKRLFRSNLIDALKAKPRASMMAVVGKYLSEVGALEPPPKPPANPLASTPETVKRQLPFPATDNAERVEQNPALEYLEHLDGLPFKSGQ